MAEKKSAVFGKLGSVSITYLHEEANEVYAKNTSSQPYSCSDGSTHYRGGPLSDDGAMCTLSYIE